MSSKSKGSYVVPDYSHNLVSDYRGALGIYSKEKYRKNSKKSKSYYSKQLDNGKAYLVRISDSYLFGGNRSHHYILYKDQNSNKLRAVQTTHLVKPDMQSVSDVKNGSLKVTKFPQLKDHSCVYNYYFDSDFSSKPIDLYDSSVQFLKGKSLSDSFLDQVKDFSSLTSSQHQNSLSSKKYSNKRSP